MVPAETHLTEEEALILQSLARLNVELESRKLSAQEISELNAPLFADGAENESEGEEDSNPGARGGRGRSKARARHEELDHGYDARTGRRDVDRVRQLRRQRKKERRNSELRWADLRSRRFCFLSFSLRYEYACCVVSDDFIVLRSARLAAELAREEEALSAAKAKAAQITTTSPHSTAHAASEHDEDADTDLSGAMGAVTFEENAHERTPAYEKDAYSVCSDVSQRDLVPQHPRPSSTLLLDAERDQALRRAGSQRSVRSGASSRTSSRLHRRRAASAKTRYTPSGAKRTTPQRRAGSASKVGA